jgi:hypothetical protein
MSSQKSTREKTEYGSWGNKEENTNLKPGLPPEKAKVEERLSVYEGRATRFLEIYTPFGFPPLQE